MADSNGTMNNTPERRRKNRHSLWGWGVAALYGGFALFMLGLVGYASLLDFQVVEEDYYGKGLAYQDRIDKKASASTLDEDVSWSFDAAVNELTISFPQEFSSPEIQGMIALFRPSNARLDKAVVIGLDRENRQLIDCAGMAKGLWKIKIDWSVGDRSFYYEDLLVFE
ncbi:MAG: FixH family protein [bacterium]|nr:FixH family protein [bacterium]